MAHIELPEGYPGISGAFTYRPETAKPMRELAHVLLHEPNSLTAGERELIATYVSSRNDCHFCQSSHGAAAACHLGNAAVVEQVKTDFQVAPVSDKLVTAADVEAARKQGATDTEIHDTVLIAAAFSMFNRYVDGLGTWQPRDPEMYARMGRHLADEGYKEPSIRQPVHAG